ncbi:MAG TPA: serine hydrolase domain-containing protein [Candidatus Acidoferrales bacterium]|jgi:D-alanyl-D-alanine carboxypeptidase|nr:serine hydrolase domain-containing protein [Candidatus Acidoferrales bacterium]
MNRFKLGTLLFLVVLAFHCAKAGNVETLLQTEMRQHHVAGLACLILRDGKPLTTFYAGVANVEWQTPVDAKTAFEIGSVSKQFAAASILLLAEDGKLSVDDNISKYLTNTPPSWANIKIRHLLSHTSGLRNYDGLDGFELRLHLTQAKFIKKLAEQPLDFQPGESWSYSNSGYNLLGYIVENVSGKNYWDFLRERIFTPLSMTNTTHRESWLVIPHRAAGYVFSTNNSTYRNRDYDLTDLFAAGSIVSTVPDLAKWDAALIGDRLLKESSKQLWWTPALLNNGKPIGHDRHGETGSYGFGWFLGTLQGHKNIGHSGITSGFSADNEMFPDDHLTIILLSNTDEGYFASNLATKVATQLFSEAKRK